jgi:hypothetical protein
VASLVSVSSPALTEWFATPFSDRRLFTCGPPDNEKVPTPTISYLKHHHRHLALQLKFRKSFITAEDIFDACRKK